MDARLRLEQLRRQKSRPNNRNKSVAAKSIGGRIGIQTNARRAANQTIGVANNQRPVKDLRQIIGGGNSTSRVMKAKAKTDSKLKPELQARIGLFSKNFNNRRLQMDIEV